MSINLVYCPSSKLVYRPAEGAGSLAALRRQPSRSSVRFFSPVLQ